VVIISYPPAPQLAHPSAGREWQPLEELRANFTAAVYDILTKEERKDAAGEDAATAGSIPRVRILRPLSPEGANLKSSS
jgi:hypothetical protein